MAQIALSLLGQTFGRLRVIARAPASSSMRTSQWACICTCGNECVKSGPAMARGAIQSCGCLNLETKRANGRRNVDTGLLRRIRRTHGESARHHRSVEYAAWANAKQRCYNTRNTDYKDYGGRGITMCARWRNSFELFLEDVGRKPDSTYLIDRIDVNGHYEPDNIRWVSPAVSRLNQRQRRYV